MRRINVIVLSVIGIGLLVSFLTFQPAKSMPAKQGQNLEQKQEIKKQPLSIFTDGPLTILKEEGFGRLLMHMIAPLIGLVLVIVIFGSVVIIVARTVWNFFNLNR